MRFAAAYAFALSAAILVAQPAASPEDLYQRARQRVLDDAARLANFTCVQTITRRAYATDPRKRSPSCDEIIRVRNAGKRNAPLSLWDRLRLDVAIADKKEVYSWVGAERFEQDDLQQLVGGQTMTGDFGPLALSVFSDHPAMSYQGERKIAERRLFEYAYRTPEESSQFRIRFGWLQFTTAYAGSVFLDPVTSDVVRVTVRSAILPEQSGYCQVTRELDYARLRTGAGDALIPREASSLAIDRDGTEMEYASTYAGCRQYKGESALRFDDPDPKASGATTSANALPAPGPPPTIPPGLPFECRITTSIDSGTAAAGDRIDATLLTPIKDSSGNVLAPAGAHIHGRLMTFAERPRNGTGKQHYVVGVQLRSIDLGPIQVPFAATLVAEKNTKGIRLSLRPGTPTMYFYQKDLHLTGLDANWVTAAPDQTKIPAR